MTAPDEPDMIAAELALGVLEGDERAAALRRVLSDPTFARDVERWRERLGALHAGWPEKEPGAAAGRRAAGIPSRGRDAAARWRWIAAASSVAAAALLALVILPVREKQTLPSPPERRAPALVAVITPAGGHPVGATIDLRTREARLGAPIDVPAGRIAELWIIGVDGVPRAAGLMPGIKTTVASDVAVSAGDTLAISIEPPGGSPKATPSGPVVATGKLAPA